MSRKDLRAYLSLAALLATQTACAAAETLPIKNISVDASKQLVVQFGGAAGSFPSVPHVLDLPGPNHRVVLDFNEATIDKNALPAADTLSAAVQQSLPFVKSIRYSNLENAPTPTARLVLDVPQDAKFKPRVVKLEEGEVIISLGDELPGIPATAAAPAAGLAPDAVAEVATPKAGETPIGEEVTAAEAAAPSESAAPASAELKAPMPVETAATPASTTAAAEEAAMTEATSVPASTEAPVAATEPVATPAAIETPVATTAPAPAMTTSPEPGPEAMGTTEPAAAIASPVTSESSEADKKLAAVRHYNLAVAAHLQGKLAEAITEYKASLEANGSLAEAHSNLGLIFNQQHNYAQALAEFRKALAINPKDAITYNGIGAALRAERDLQGAIKNWQTAVSLDPKLATAHYNLGTAYEIDKDYDKALDSYGSAVKNDYRLGEAYYRMGLIWERKKKSDEAASQFKEALKVSSDSEYSEDARQRLAFLQKGSKPKTK
jgi:tetratricopeptide (TPR) repeat protein